MKKLYINTTTINISYIDRHCSSINEKKLATNTQKSYINLLYGSNDSGSNELKPSI